MVIIKKMSASLHILNQDMTTEPSFIQEHLCRNDVHLKHIIEILPKPTHETTGDVFFDVTSCIIGQQIHYRRETTRFELFKSLFSNQYPRPEAVASLNVETFLTLKISSQKYYTLCRLSEWWIKNSIGEMDWNAKSDDEIRKMLLAIKGIGPWTVDMILMWTLERWDVFPSDDYSLKKVMTRVYGLNPDENLKAQMTEIASRWMPHRSLACRYLWAYV
jgi:DNA-3-methyladenine glycosylase II